MGQVDGKVALITGGASGIRAACAEKLASEGATIVIGDLDQPRANEVVSSIKSHGGRAVAYAQDVTDKKAWVSVMEKIEQSFGPLDILVANAGIAMLTPFFL